MKTIRDSNSSPSCVLFLKCFCFVLSLVVLKIQDEASDGAVSGGSLKRCRINYDWTIVVYL